MQGCGKRNPAMAHLVKRALAHAMHGLARRTSRRLAWSPRDRRPGQRRCRCAAATSPVPGQRGVARQEHRNTPLVRCPWRSCIGMPKGFRTRSTSRHRRWHRSSASLLARDIGRGQSREDARLTRSQMLSGIPFFHTIPSITLNRSSTLASVSHLSMKALPEFARRSSSGPAAKFDSIESESSRRLGQPRVRRGFPPPR
jgi:hypothetical protein